MTLLPRQIRLDLIRLAAMINCADDLIASNCSVIAGSAAVVSDASARVEYHATELEKAMRDLYGREVEVLRFEPDKGMVACVMVAANGGATARPAANSKWLYIGQEVIAPQEVRRQRNL